MGIAEQIRQAYRKIDIRLGGRLPGGVPVGYKEPVKESPFDKPTTFTSTL